MREKNHSFRRAHWLAIIAILMVAREPAAMAEDTPGIIAPDGHPFGHSYGDWATQWTRWALGIPAARNPLIDTTGEFCDEDQSGPVWFLAGSLGQSVERTCTVPHNKALFLPVYTAVWGAGAFDCEPSVPGVECDIDDLRELAAGYAEAVDVLEVTIDGRPIANIRRYRASSPEPFAIDYPENSITGLPMGTYYPNVTDGYWLMLTPQSPGWHTIQVYARADDTVLGPIVYLLEYHLKVL